MTVEERIKSGALPRALDGEDWKRYHGSGRHAATWQGWLDAWWGIMWVRLQAFERDAEAEWAAEEYEESIAAGGWY